MDLFRNRDATAAVPNPLLVPTPGSPDDHPGWFQECDLDADMLGTPIGAYWLNMMTAEIRNAILDGQVSPLYTDWNQLALAIRNTARRVIEAYVPSPPPPLVVRPSPGPGEFPDINSALATVSGKLILKNVTQLVDISGDFPSHPPVFIPDDNIRIVATGVGASLTIAAAEHGITIAGKNVSLENLTISYTGAFSGLAVYPDASATVLGMTITGSSASGSGMSAAGGILTVGGCAISGFNECFYVDGRGELDLGSGTPERFFDLTPRSGGTGIVANGAVVMPRYGIGTSMQIRIHGGAVGLYATFGGRIELNGEVSVNDATTGYRAEQLGLIRGKGASPGTVSADAATYGLVI